LARVLRCQEFELIMTLISLGLVFFSLLALLAVVSALETAIHTVRELEGTGLNMGEEREEDSGLVRRLRKIRQNPFAQLQQTLLLSAALNLALALLGLYLVTGPLRGMGWNVWLLAPVLFGGTVLLGDALPKLYARRRAPALLVIGSRLLLPVRLLLDPLARLAERAADAVLRRLVPSGLKVRSGMTREEFETLVEMRQEQRVVTADEAAMIQEVLDLEALNVRDAMVPRVDLPLAFSGRSEAAMTAMLETAASRFVVVHGETPDVVEGVVDTLAWKLEGRPPWREMLRPAVFVPETLPLLDALNRHLGEASSVVLVVDEYGGLEGLVSQDEIADWLLHEAAPWLGEDAEIRELEPGRFLLDGGARLDHILDELGVSLAPEEAEGIDTVGGLVFKLLGHVPKPGERLLIGEVQLKVRRMARARVKQVEMRVPERVGDEGEVAT
jgi:putative hemolysin